MLVGQHFYFYIKHGSYADWLVALMAVLRLVFLCLLYFSFTPLFFICTQCEQLLPHSELFLALWQESPCAQFPDFISAKCLEYVD